MGESNKEDIGGEIVTAEDKMKLKQQALSAGIIGSSRHHANVAKASSTQVPPRMQRKSESERRDSSRSKGTRGSSGGRGGTHGPGRESTGRPPRSGGGSLPVTKQNSSDVGDECWETTSENSELDDRERKLDVHNGRKAFPRHHEPPGSSRRNSGVGLNNCAPRTGRGGSGGMGSTPGSGGGSSRAPGAEKRAGNNNGYGGGNGGQRGTSSTAVGIALQANGRAPGPRPSGGSQSAAVAGTKVPMKETTTAVNRVDEIKLNDPSLVSQALSELNSSKKNVRVEKEKSNALEGIDLNNYASK